MKITLSLLLAACIITSAQAQKRYRYYLSDSLTMEPKESATIIGNGQWADSVFMLDCYDAVTNQLLMNIGFQDSTLEIMEGPVKKYAPSGMLTQEGYHHNNLQSGSWKNYGGSGEIQHESIFENGEPVRQHIYHYIHPFGMYMKRSIDLETNTIEEKGYSLETGQPTYVARFLGNRGLFRQYDAAGNVTSTDSVFTRVTKGATVEGGMTAFNKFITEQMNKEIFPFYDKLKTYKATLIFTVTTQGKIKDIVTLPGSERELEYSLIRTLRLAPRWSPAVYYGIPVNSRQMLVFTMQFMNDNLYGSNADIMNFP